MGLGLTRLTASALGFLAFLRCHAMKLGLVSSGKKGHFYREGNTVGWLKEKAQAGHSQVGSWQKTHGHVQSMLQHKLSPAQTADTWPKQCCRLKLLCVACYIPIVHWHRRFTLRLYLYDTHYTGEEMEEYIFRHHTANAWRSRDSTKAVWLHRHPRNQPNN